MTPIKFPHKQFLENNKDIIAVHRMPDMLQKRILGFDELEEDLPHTTGEDHTRLLGKLENLSHELDEDLEEYFERWLENNDEEEDEEEPAVPEPVAELPEEEPVLTEEAPAPEPEIAETPAEMPEAEPIVTEEAPATEVAGKEPPAEVPEEPGTEEKSEVPEETAEAGEEPESVQEPELAQEAEPEPESEQEEQPAEEPAEAPQKEPEPVLELTDENILQALLEEKQVSVHPSELRKKGFKGILGPRMILIGKFCLHRGKYDTCYRIVLRGE